MTNIRIEICKSPWKKGTYNIRIGDIEGSSECSNISEEEVIDEIKDAIEEKLKSLNSQGSSKQTTDASSESSVLELDEKFPDARKGKGKGK